MKVKHVVLLSIIIVALFAMILVPLITYLIYL